MSENTKIEWCDHTFNPWTGCMKVSPGCDNCYAEGWSKRAGAKVGKWGPGAPRVRTTAANWKLPIKWEAGAKAFQAAHGRRQRVFCASLADVFDNEVDPQWRADLFALIMATPSLDWLLVTKRIGNVTRMVPPEWLAPGGWPKNVRLMITVVNQKEADHDIPRLLAIDCPNGLSIEPMLGAIDLTELQGPGAARTWIDALRGSASDMGASGPTYKVRAIDWVIAGGESGPGARPSHPDWFMDLRDQCAEAGVPFLFKQWGEWASGENGNGPPRRTEQVATWWNGKWDFSSLTPRMSAQLHSDDAPDVYRLGKKTAGRHLEGVEHNGFPS